MDDTYRMKLPLLAAAQAQKHVTHNEALMLLDAVVQLSFASVNLATPPSQPLDGMCVLVGDSPSGAFAGHAGAIAIFDAGGWLFMDPFAGCRAYVEDDAALLVFDGAQWRAFEEFVKELQMLERVGLGTNADVNNPFAVKANNALFTSRATGEGGNGDLRLTVNKQSTSNTVSHIYQSNYSARAEAGLIGSDAFKLKVSADGAVWKEALAADPSTGHVSFPSGVSGPGTGLSLKRIDVFASSGTFEKQAGDVLYFVQLIGGGGGGGAGARSASGTIAGGGGGGNGGYAIEAWFPADVVSASSPVIVGAGGAGAVVSANGTVGAAGSSGGNSSLGSLLLGPGGPGGAGGTASAGGAGKIGSYDLDNIPAARTGGAAGGGAAVGGSTWHCNRSSGGAGGGGVSAANAAYAGGSAGAGGTSSPVYRCYGGSGGSIGAAGGTGQSVVFAYSWGAGGGGGGAAVSVNSGDGGPGGAGGGGGGGGGGGRNNFSGGAGGAGGRGEVRVFVFG